MIAAGKPAALAGYQFTREELLEQALTHRSFARKQNNERLEFLGDSVLGQIISQYIYHHFPDADEGDLSRIRASLVKKETLASVARSLDLGDHIRLGEGELKSGGFRRSSILADALEALIAAIYLDSDYERTESVVLALFADRLQQLSLHGPAQKDAKTRLQEQLQARQLQLPAYEVIHSSGKAHEKTFTVRCLQQDLGIEGRGTGSSRKKAEQQAAEQLLARLSS